MSSTTGADAPASAGLESRILREAFGPGAWHGADLKAAIADVTPAVAFWRPGEGRHNIAEVAMHHAYYTRSVRSRISGMADTPFVLEGEDWFPVPDAGTLPWEGITGTVDLEHRRLAELIADIEADRVGSPLSDAERFDLVLGITCHAIYHAGQIQLIKKLRGES